MSYDLAMNLSQTILGVSFKNPTVLAAGMMGITASGWKLVGSKGAGAVTTKSMWAKEHVGNPNPVVISTPDWTLNAVGLPYAGKEVAVEEVGAYMAEHPVPLIANVVGLTPEDFAEITAAVAPLRPDLFEVNISSPTFLKLRGSFFEGADDIGAVLKAVKKVAAGIPVFIKLSPNVANIGEVAKACVAAGADGITAINTVGPAMAIDLRSRMPILAAHRGGVSGRGIKPIAVRCVADIYTATEGKTPIIGVGGISTGEDALEMMLAGASLVGIGTAIAERDLEVFRLISEEMHAWCGKEGIADISEMTGGMHREIAAHVSI